MKYVANSLNAYGYGHSETEALANFACHAQHNDGPVEVHIIGYEGEASCIPNEIRVDGEIKIDDTFELTREQLQEIADLSGELELLVDSTLADAPKVDQ